MATQVTLNSGAVSSAGSLKLQTNGTTDAVTIDTAQNLGLGVTPSAWVNFKVLEGSNGGYFAVQFNNTAMNTGLNTYFSGTNWVYKTSNYATQYQQYNGQHQWYTAPSGTAGNPITFTQAMTLDASGNLLVGATSQVNSSRVGIASTGKFGLTVIDTTSYAQGVGGALNLGGNYRNSGDAQAFTQVAAYKENATDGNYAYAMTFSTYPNGGSLTERARIDSSGNLLVGTTSTVLSCKLTSVSSAGAASFQTTASAGNNTAIAGARNGNNGRVAEWWWDLGTFVGSVSVTNTATTYNTSSDYRLKDISGALTGYKERLFALQPKQGSWKVDGSEFRGFLAHEFAESYPSSVNGEKDAVDENGNPQYQGMQAGSPEVIADLVAYIQELETRLAALENK